MPDINIKMFQGWGGRFIYIKRCAYGNILFPRISKLCPCCIKPHFESPGGAVPLFGNDDFSNTLIGTIFFLIINLVPVNEGDDVSILFYRSRFS